MTETAPLHGADWLSQLDRDYRHSLLAFFRRRVGSAAEAEDMVQEVFARIYASPGIERDTAGAYIFRAAANLLRDSARRASVREAYRATLLAEESPVELHDPERVAIGRQALGEIWQALYALPERTRVVFMLYRLEGMARRDIADSFGISVSAVEKHIASATAALIRLKRKGL